MNRRLGRRQRISRSSSTQRGILLLEALISILIFTIGVLGLIGLQASSVKMSAAAEYRSIAARQASNLISQMWLSDHTPATLQTNFASPSGAGYIAWLTAVQSSGLPGVASPNLPEVSMSTVAGGGATPVASTRVTITIKWIAPGETTTTPHKFETVAQVK